MNFLQLCQYVADNSDQTRPGTVYNANLSNLSRGVRRIRNHVNRAYTLIKHALGMKNEYVETTGSISTVGGTESYDFPTGILTIQQLSVSNDPPLRILPWTEFERFKADTLLITETGSPEVASIYQRKVWFYPTPEQTYTVDVRGLATLTQLDLDEDEPTLGGEFHQAIADLALHFEMIYENNPQAGVLISNKDGSLGAQGGQAAIAIALFSAAKKNIRAHVEDSPRMISRQEMARINWTRRITRS